MANIEVTSSGNLTPRHGPTPANFQLIINYLVIIFPQIRTQRQEMVSHKFIDMSSTMQEKAHASGLME